MNEKNGTRNGEGLKMRELNRFQFRKDDGCQGGKIYVLVVDYRSTFKSERLTIRESALPE